MVFTAPPCGAPENGFMVMAYNRRILRKKKIPCRQRAGRGTNNNLKQKSASLGTNQGGLRPLVSFRDAEHNHIALIQVAHGDILQGIFMKENLLLI